MMLAERPVSTADRYAQAEQLLIGHAAELIIGGEITPTFTGRGCGTISSGTSAEKILRPTEFPHGH